jgi:phenylacetate-coenzyme A ligase PaaK-like adenylate-forming protein
MHYASFFKGKFQSDRLRQAPKEQIEAYRERAFRETLKHAFRHSLFYRSHYQSNGIFERHLDSVRMTDLPEVSKKVLMDHFDEVVTRPEVNREALTKFFRERKDPATKLHGKYIAMHSSGTTGVLGMFVLSSSEFARVLASMASHSESSKAKQHRLAYFGAIDGHYAGSTLLSQVPRMMMRCELFSVLAPLSQTIAAINQYQPDALSGYASSVALLAEEQLAGRLQIRPTRISCGAEPLTSGIRDLVQRAFGVAPRNAYGACEALNIAYQCEEDGTDLVLSEDLYACEFADNLHVTSLYSRLMPIIRYRIEDRVIATPGVPARGFRSIRSIDGRTEQWLDIPVKDGAMDRLIAPALANFYVPGLERIQFRQRSDAHIDIHYTGSREIAGHVQERLWELVTAKNPSSNISVSVLHCDTIPASRDTGKTALIVKQS